MILSIQAPPKHLTRPPLLGLFLFVILNGCTEEVTRGSFEKTAPGCFEVIRAEKWPGPDHAAFCQRPGTRFPIVDMRASDRGLKVALTGLGQQAVGQWFWKVDLERLGRVSVKKASETTALSQLLLLIFGIGLASVILVLAFRTVWQKMPYSLPSWPLRGSMLGSSIPLRQGWSSRFRAFASAHFGSKAKVAGGYLIWIGASVGGIFLANWLVETVPSVLTWIIAVVIWLISFPGALAAILALIPVVISVLVFPGSTVMAVIALLIGITVAAMFVASFFGEWSGGVGSSGGGSDGSSSGASWSGRTPCSVYGHLSGRLPRRSGCG